MRVLSIDFGTVRIGTAISDELGIIASPLEVVPASATAASEIAALATKHNAGCVVIGMPYALDGTETDMTRATREFMNKLAALLPCPIVEWDEAFSSRAALSGMIGAGVKRGRRRQKGTTDTWAAAIILQGYLDSLR